MLSFLFGIMIPFAIILLRRALNIKVISKADIAKMTSIPIKLVDQHVDAVRAIIREHARADVADVAVALTRRLREVTDDFLKRENSFRPDYLQSIFSPSLQPGLADM